MSEAGEKVKASCDRLFDAVRDVAAMVDSGEADRDTRAYHAARALVRVRAQDSMPELLAMIMILIEGYAELAGYPAPPTTEGPGTPEADPWAALDETLAGILAANQPEADRG